MKTNASATVEARGMGKWLVRAKRQHGSDSATGEVMVEQKTPPDRRNPPHAALAGSRAWLALGEKRLAAHDAKGAVACAQAGLDELGSGYASPLVVDDTSMKLLAAKERIEQGHIEDGAKVMLRMLQTRTTLYAKRHQDTIAK